MSDPHAPVPQSPRPAGGDGRRLDRAPGERYGAGGPGGKGTGGKGGAIGGRRATRALLAGAIVADAGAALFFLLGLLDFGIGLVVVAAFTGWATALALVWWGRDAIAVARTRVATAAILGAWSVVAGIVVDWLYALLQGGVLGPLDYVGQRYGIVALLSVVAAAGIAAFRVR